MANYIFPRKLKVGDEIRVIAPSFSMTKIPDNVRKIAEERFASVGIKITYGKHTGENDMYESSSVESRLGDLMDAFGDKKVAGIITAVGGYNSNYLLDQIDWEVIKNNPKFFCGMSDITVLSNAFLAKTGLVTYSGPNFRNFGQEKYYEYTWEYFKKILFESEPIEITKSESWSDDKWVKDQSNRKLVKNRGWWVINDGEAEGEIIGGNLCSLNLLQGTEYMPDIANKILFIEDDSMSTVGEFSRNWQSLMHLKEFASVKGVVFGRFQKKTKMTEKLLAGLIKMKPELNKIPVIGNVDFGHTDPKITFPVGGVAKIMVKNGDSKIEILKY